MIEEFYFNIIYFNNVSYIYNQIFLNLNINIIKLFYIFISQDNFFHI